MSKIITLITAALMLVTLNTALATGPTADPWSSFRHDLFNSGQATGGGYPDTLNKLWMVDREDRSYLPGEPAGSRGPSVVDRGMVITAGTGVIQANDQFTGSLIWSKYFLWEPPEEPAGAPSDWCYNDIPAVEGNTGICYVENMVDCPSWCFQCTTDEPDCIKDEDGGFSLVLPLAFPDGYDQFLTGPTMAPSYGTHGSVLFGTFNGHVISLNANDGSTLWDRTPYKDPGGPSALQPWYNQKFAWHLSPPSIADGRIFIASFLPSFYAIFTPWAYVSPGEPGYPWPTIGNDAIQYWVGRDGYFYGLDEDNGDILWTWDPRGCGVTNIPPVHEGKVFINADTATDYHYGQFATVDAATGEELWHVGTIPLAQGGSQAISGDVIYTPGGDGALWALNVNTGQVQWTHWAGFNVRGAVGLCSAPAVDESRGWVIGAADTGRMFVLNKDTGRIVKEAFLGVPGWNVFDPYPVSGYWLPGPSGISISPEDGLLYVAGTDFDNAWLGSQFDKSREKLFCYDYVTDPNTLILKWEYQFCADDDCSSEAKELIIRGHGPYVVAWYSIPSPALADGHVYYASTNGKIYCFGSDFPTDDSDADGNIDYRDNCPSIQNGPNGGTCTSGSIGDPCTIPGDNISECGAEGFCSMDQEDADGDLVGDACDDCNDIVDFDNYCLDDICPETFDPNQKDSYPPSGNTCGNACECEGNFDDDDNQDGSDAVIFKVDFGRNSYSTPCSGADPCDGDFDCDVDVDGTDAALFKSDFGRNSYNAPCPSCPTDPWCTY